MTSHDVLERRESREQALREQIFEDERHAFLVAAHDCSLVLAACDTTLWYRIFDDLLLGDTPAIWRIRRALFDALLSSAAGRAWLSERAKQHANDVANSADIND